MKVSLIIDISDESIEKQREIIGLTKKFADEVERKFGTPEANAPERVAVTPEAVDRCDELRRSQMRRDRERLNDLGIHVDIFQSDFSEG